jgi:hypothetical protein
MPGFEDTKAVLHPVRVKLYPNYLTDEGKYIARTSAYRSLSVEDVCGNLRERGSFTGNPEDAANNIKQFCEECGFLICDGFSLNMEYYSISPHVSGTWDSPNEAHDREKHPIGFTFRALKPLKDLAGRIELSVEGIVEDPAYIDHVTDVSSGTVNEVLTPGGVVVITGHQIKIAGTKSGVGLYVSGAYPGGQAFSTVVPPPYVENTASKVIAVLPASLPNAPCKIQIDTQYTSNNTLLKDIRTIWSGNLTVGTSAQSGDSPAPVEGSGTEQGA